MPSRWAQFVIIVFWLVMTGWLVRRDILPIVGSGEVNYRAIVARLAVEEPTHWFLRLDDRRIGSVVSSVRPEPDGSYVLTSRADLSGDLMSARDPNGSLIQIRSDFLVSPAGRLQRIEMQVRTDHARTAITVSGEVRQNQLVLQTKGLPMAEPITIPVDPEALTVDLFGSVDRLPDLYRGKTWVTRTVNPLGGLTSPTHLLRGSALALENVRHEVVDQAPIYWGTDWWPCYVIEHRHRDTLARTWARVADGRVLKQEIPLLGWLLVMERDPLLDTLP